jgi:hypothetical protein
MNKKLFCFLCFIAAGTVIGQTLEERILDYHKEVLEKRFPPEEVNIYQKLITTDINRDGSEDFLVDYSLTVITNFGATRSLGNGVTIFTIKADTLDNVFDFLIDGGGSTLAVYDGIIYRGNEEYTPPFDFESFYQLTFDEKKEKSQKGFIKDTLVSVITSNDFELLRKFPDKFENFIVLPDVSIEWDYNIREVLNDSKNYRFPIIGIDIGDISLNKPKIYSTITEDMAFKIISDKKLYKSDENALRNLNTARVFGKIVRNKYNGNDLPRYYFEIHQIIMTDEYNNPTKIYERN